MASSVGSRRNGLLWKCLLSFVIFVSGASSLVVTSIQLQTNRRENWVFHGEKAILTCHFNVFHGEEVTKVEWTMDDKDNNGHRINKEVYIWRNNLPPVAKGPFKGRVDLNTKAANVINITEAHMDMHGEIFCKVSTAQKTTEDMFNLIVVVDACPESSWHHHSIAKDCSETITMRCTGIFPHPSPQCGPYSERKQSFIRSDPFDSVRKLDNGTYEISFTRKLNIEEFINMTDIYYVCNLIIQDTSWKRSVKLKLFGDTGCPSEAPEIDEGYYNLTDGRTCWGNPSEGTEAIYTCDEGLSLHQAEKLICHNGSWVSEKIVGHTKIIRENVWPYCSDGATVTYSVTAILTAIFVTMYRLPNN